MPLLRRPCVSCDTLMSESHRKWFGVPCILGTEECWRDGGGLGDQLPAPGECSLPSEEAPSSPHRIFVNILPTCLGARFLHVGRISSHSAASLVHNALVIDEPIPFSRCALCQVMMDFLKEWETKLQMKITCSQVCRCSMLLVWYLLAKGAAVLRQ